MNNSDTAQEALNSSTSDTSQALKPSGLSPECQHTATLETMPFQFGKLPEELQLRICAHYFRGYKLKCKHPRDGPWESAPILQVSKETRRVAMEAMEKNAVIQVEICASGIHIRNRTLRLSNPYQPVWNAKNLPDHLTPLFKNLRNIEILVTDFHRLDWEDMDSEMREGYFDVNWEDDRDACDVIDHNVNKPYNVRQHVTRLATFLQLSSKLQHVFVRPGDCEWDNDDFAWVLEPLAALRNIREVEIDGFDYFDDSECFPHMEHWQLSDYFDNPEYLALRKMVRTMKGNSKVKTRTTAQRLQEDFAQLADFVLRFNIYLEGPWAMEVRRKLFEARVAMSAEEEEAFAQHRRTILTLWDNEVARRKAQEAHVAASSSLVRAQLAK